MTRPPEASWPYPGEQLALPLEEPVQPECRPGDRVRVMVTGFSQAYPGAPVQHPVRVYDGVLDRIVLAGEHPVGRPFTERQSATSSKYDRWVVKVEKINGQRAWRFGAGSKYQIAILVMNKSTKGFLYDLAE